MELPKDPMMLFSFINMNVSKEDILNRLKEVGFEYNPSQNKFW